MTGFYAAMTGFPEPWWITCECPQCSGGLGQTLICEHGFLFSCSGCSFKEFVPFQGVEDECSACAPFIIQDESNFFPEEAA